MTQVCGVWRINMYTLLSVIVICGTILTWSNRYLQPYIKPKKQDKVSQEQLDEVQEDAFNFDNIIAEIYERLDEDEH